MKGVITLPRSAVKTETDRISKVEKNYVWKLEDKEIVKEYVTLYESAVSAEKACVINGIKPGDQILNDNVYHNENNS